MSNAAVEGWTVYYGGRSVTFSSWALTQQALKELTRRNPGERVSVRTGA